MEFTAAIIYINFLMFALAGILLVGATNKFTEACRLFREARNLAIRIQLSRRRRR